MPTYHIASFSSDATPPLGHPLCGGWIEPVRGITDPLKALGVVLLGAGKPIVFCSVDWTGLRNDAYRIWRAALADAAHTVPENVALHCIHPHNTPFADVGAQMLIAAANGPPSLDLKFYERVVADSAEALRKSLAKTAAFTHVGVGTGKVEHVASNRRVLGPDGKVKYTRTSATKNKAARDAPEGLIDPVLRTLSFWDGDRPLAALNFYTTHPMSYYGDGMVTPDFCGLARQKRQDEDPSIFQVYFTGCAGNVTAGKYNDGAKENRPILRDRVYAGMVAAWKATERLPVTGWRWYVEPVKLPPRTESSFGEEQSTKDLNDPKQTKARRDNAAFQLAWLKRKDVPIEVTSLDFGPKVKTLHLPGEPFVEYQLAAHKLRPDATVFVAGYGDDGPGYIPTAPGYLQGGYEPTVALSGPGSEAILLKAIAKVLDADPRRLGK
ncbi:MAG TPA: hypothetical protein VFG68_08450 [Fimbriiglobus sp.]|nr:hypothetical protein [Fimbriiglobus sp.]